MSGPSGAALPVSHKVKVIEFGLLPKLSQVVFVVVSRVAHGPRRVRSVRVEPHSSLGKWWIPFRSFKIREPLRLLCGKRKKKHIVN